MTPENRPESAALLVRLGDRQYGLPLASVERVLPMAYIAALPDRVILTEEQREQALKAARGEQELV